MTDRDWRYRLVLQLYPPAFRRSFGREMMLVHADQRRAGAVDGRYWTAVMGDALTAAPRLWLEELHEGLLATEGTVKTMAILALLIGLFETANALAEVRAIGFGAHDGVSQVMLVLAIATGVLLAIAGVALLFRGNAARRFAWAGAAGCLGAFALMIVARPLLSALATLLGIGFPLALALFLYRTRDRVVA